LKLSGTAELPGAPEEVFDRLLDPAVLASCISGCQRLERVGDNAYELEVKTGVGAVQGSFRGRVTLSDVRRFEGYRMDIEGKSSIGHVKGQADVRLSRKGSGTRIDYDAEGKISGLLASVGARLIDASARKVAQQFFERLAKAVGTPP
jgi:carbon monoxide dehydrogenase subunit G